MRSDLDGLDSLQQQQQRQQWTTSRVVHRPARPRPRPELNELSKTSVHDTAMPRGRIDA
jgi:hypothetical protein